MTTWTYHEEALNRIWPSIC